MKQSKFKAKQKGFTLIELVITVMILGILAIVVVKQFGEKVTGGAKAGALYETANKIAQNWVLLNQQAGTSSVISGSVIPASGKNALDVLIGGSANIASTYQGSWNQAGLSPLTDVATGSAGSYSVSGYAVTLGGGGTSPITITYAGVPDDTVQQLVTKYGSGVSTLATSDTTNGVIQYGTASGGARSLTIVKQN